MSTDSKYENLYKDAYQALIHNDLAKATQKINALVDYKPCDAHVRLLRGNIYFALSDFETALREYQLVLIFSCNSHLNEKAMKGIEACCRHYQENLLPIPQASSLHSLVSLSRAVPKPIQRIELSMNEVVELYNNIPQILEPIALKASLTTRSYRNADGEAWLEKHPQGKYWIILTQNDKGENRDFLLPNGDVEIDWSKLKKSHLLFQISGNNRGTNIFFLEKPGFLEIHSSGQYWQVQKKGLVNAKKPQLPYDDLVRQINEFQSNIERYEAQINSLKEILQVILTKEADMLGNQSKRRNLLQQLLSHFNID